MQGIEAAFVAHETPINKNLLADCPQIVLNQMNLFAF